MAEPVTVKPELIRWAIDRSRLPAEDLAHAFPRLDEWRTGKRMPTHRQLALFATKTMTPLGYFFLDSPPVEKLPIPDFRTVGDGPIGRPSPNLIDTIQVMLRRQGWIREYLVEEGHEPLDFVASAKNVHNVVSTNVDNAAACCRKLPLPMVRPGFARRAGPLWMRPSGTERKADVSSNTASERRNDWFPSGR